MNISRLFIERPVMTTLLTLLAAIFGVMAYTKLPVNDLPNVDFPVITVTASLSGASPETMASSVAMVLEKQFSTIPGLDTMTSSSTMGSTSITLRFKLERDIDAAAQDVQSAIAQAGRKLPSDMTTPPSFRKVNPGDMPIMYIALSSATLPMSMVDHYAQNLISQRLSTLDGVAEVQVFGTRKYAVRIQLDPKLLAVRELGIDEVQQAITGANVNQPTGSIDGTHNALTIQADGQLFNAESYRKLVICYRNGAPVRLQDVADVYDSIENNKFTAYFMDAGNIRESVVLGVMRQPGANTVKVAGEINRVLPELISQLPPSVKFEKLFDRAEGISHSIFDVEFTMVITLFLVVLVIYCFLRNFRATAIPSLTLPMSVLGTFIVMYLGSYSLDNLSLMALTLSIGFIVDDAVVMLENIFRHLEMGKSVRQAALDGSNEIGFTILSMTLSLAAVFIPILFMSGLIGRFFQEFGVVISGSVLISGVVSLTLIPMLASRFLRKHEGGGHAAAEVPARANFYETTLRKVVGHWAAMLGFSLLVLGATVYLYMVLPKGFLPDEDQNLLRGRTEAMQGISFAELNRNTLKVGEVVRRDPDVEALFISCSGNSGNMMIRLKPRNQRETPAAAIVTRLRRELAAIPGIKAYVSVPAQINISGGKSSSSQYQYTLISSDVDALRRAAAEAEMKMRKIAILEDISSDLQITNPELNLAINRDKAALFGIKVSDIENALYNAFGPNDISTIYGADDQYSVLLELKNAFRGDRDSLKTLYVRSAKGELVPLADLVSVSTGAGVFSVNHYGQMPSVTISFNLKSGASISEAVGMIEKEIDSGLPGSVASLFQGTAQAFKDSTSGMLLLLAVTILVIYVILGVLYEDFLHPLTILTALPFAGFGALLSLYACGTDLSLYAFIGIIMLVGIVKKNGIMMVDFAIEIRRREHLPPAEAIVQASVVRFRPIMMTTAAAIIAGIPIAIGWGGGGESRRPLGIVIVGGLIFSQLLTLYVTPSLYVGMEKLRAKLAGPAAATGGSGDPE